MSDGVILIGAVGRQGPCRRCPEAADETARGTPAKSTLRTSYLGQTYHRSREGDGNKRTGKTHVPGPESLLEEDAHRVPEERDLTLKVVEGLGSGGLGELFDS
jgi:hypothetical protein